MCLQGWLGLRRRRGTDQEGNEEGKGRMLLPDSGSWDRPQRGRSSAGPAFASQSESEFAQLVSEPGCCGRDLD